MEDNRIEWSADSVRQVRLDKQDQLVKVVDMSNGVAPEGDSPSDTCLTTTWGAMRVSTTTPAHRVPFVPAFTILVLLGFSDEFLSALVNALGIDYTEGYRRLLAPVDGIILLIIAIQARRFQRRKKVRFRRVLGWVLRPWAVPWRLVRWRIVLWWSAGAALTLTTDVVAADEVWIGVLWFDLTTTVVYTSALIILYAATMGVSPLMFVLPRARRSGDWLLVRAVSPLIVGTLGAFLATCWFDYWLAPTGGVDPEFFAQMTQVIALLIVALGIEVGFFRELVTDPRQRPMAILLVSVLCVGEAMALSVLTTSRLYSWHLYLAFILTVYACLVALASLIWVLIVRPANDTSVVPPAPVVVEEATVVAKEVRVVVSASPRVSTETGVLALAAGMVAVGTAAALVWRRIR